MALETRVLDNGLTVHIDRKDEGTASLFVIVNAGFARAGQVTDTPHVLEHMQAKTYMELPELSYARKNAHTSDEKTVYEIERILEEDAQLAAENLAKVLITLNREVFAREKKTVGQEVTEYANPQYLLNVEAKRLLFPRQSVIVPTFDKRSPGGADVPKSDCYPHSVGNMTEGMCRGFFETYYGTTNVEVLLSGSLPSNDTALERIIAPFNAIMNSGKKNENFTWPDEETFRERQEVSGRVSPKPGVALALFWQLDGIMKDWPTEDAVALIVLRNYLNMMGGPLFKELRHDRQLVYSCGATIDGFGENNAFVVHAASPDEGSVPALEDGIRIALTNVIDKGISPSIIDGQRKMSIVTNRREMRKSNYGDFLGRQKYPRFYAERDNAFATVNSDQVVKQAANLLEKPYLVQKSYQLKS